MKKAFDQTVRDLKREVNKKVLKVPSIEQKVLDATSNEPWGPHGSVLADIAQSTRNYHEYQMIMSVIWKRTNDTGKNWRHVYKALVVLEYLVAHGSERVIDDIREHAYQISTLSDFQYIDSSGRDQGNNVRKKSQSLVVLVNDKERIQEVRQKAAANRDKFRSNQTGSMYRHGSFSSPGYGDRYDDDRYEGRYRDDERNSNGRERDDDRYGRYGDAYNRDGDRYSRDNEDRYSRDGSRDDDYHGRSQSYDANHHGSRGRSVDHYKNATEDDSQYSSRGSGAKADDNSQDGSTMGKKLDRKYSGQSFGAPPSYEDVVGASQSPTYSDRDGDSSLASAPKASSPKGASPRDKIVVAVPLPAPASPAAQASASAAASVPASTQPINKEVDGFDEFDPRGSFPAAPLPSNGAAPTSDAEIDLLGSLSESYSSNSFALVPAGQATGSDVDASANLNTGSSVAAPLPHSTINSQPFDDPFGDGIFRAVPSSNSFDTSSNHSQVTPSVPQDVATEFEDTFNDGGPPPKSTQFSQQASATASQDVDILADILPPAPTDFSYAHAAYPAAPVQPAPHGGFPQASQPAPQSGLSSVTVPNAPQNGFQPQTGQPAGFPTQLGQHSMQKGYALQSAEPVSERGFAGQALALTYPVHAGQASQMGFHSQGGSGQISQLGFQTQAGFVQPNLSNANIYGNPYNSQSIPSGPSAAQNNFLSQSGPSNPVASQQGPYGISSSIVAPVSTNPSSATSSAVVLQPQRDKFETKSTVWADTLSRGLVNLNISGPKTNPMADIGIDFDAINRKEKRMEKPTPTPVTSTVTMGKAMGSGSGIGRAGAGVLRPTPNPMIGPGMNMGMATGPGAGIPMGGYGVNQPIGRGMAMGVGMGMGMNMNMPGSMGMGMNMVMGQQPMNMQQPMGYPPGAPMPGGYNMGAGNYGQPPYGGGYR